MSIELVHVLTDDDVHLDGTLRQSAGLPQLGVDAVILHHGTAGNFYTSPIFEVIEDQLAAEGCAVFRVNNRGHDYVSNAGPGRRIGASFEVLDDCRYDWKAWLDFAEVRGYSRLALWGHSSGAAKTIYYLATQAEPRVAWAVATSPPLYSYHSYIQRDADERFQSSLKRMRQAINDGHAEDTFEVQVPISALASARTYVDRYASERYNELLLLPAVKIPVLVTIGSLEGTSPKDPSWLQFGGLAAEVAAIAETKGNVAFQLVDGANHAYANKADDLWRVAHQWLNSILVKPA